MGRPAGWMYKLTGRASMRSPFAQAPDQKIVYRGQLRMTYSRPHERNARLANGLNRLGARCGSTVAAMDRDSHRYLECYFEMPMMGAVLQTVNARLSQMEIA